MTATQGPDVRPGPWLSAYRTVSGGLWRAAELCAPLSAKTAAGLRGRRGLAERIAEAAPGLQGCVWFHMTSVGEYEQARPLMRALREVRPGAPIAATHFSPSGYEYARRRPQADFHDYLPLDRRQDMADLVRTWRPRLLVFVKFDCWPNQVLAAAQAQVPVVLLAATLQPRSARLRPWARPLFRDLFDRFTHIGACTQDDARRFRERLGTTCPVTVTGDTRAEQVILRYEAARDGEVAARLNRLPGRRLILGSTWPRDEALWLPVLKDLLRAQPDLRVVLTPHEPVPSRLQELQGSLDRQGVSWALLSDLMTSPPGTVPDPRTVLVDSVGVLAEIYRCGHLAYVGGSFTTGVHNTMEPAVAGLPVLFGPVIRNAAEAGQLVARGAGRIVRRPAEALQAATQLLNDPARLADLGRKARQVVLEQRGATEKSMGIIAPLLDPR